jgi:hypothetical protein
VNYDITAIFVNNVLLVNFYEEPPKTDNISTSSPANPKLCDYNARHQNWVATGRNAAGTLLHKLLVASEFHLQ